MIFRSTKTAAALLVAAGMVLMPQMSQAADAPQAPAVLESFMCNLNPGKTMNDLMAARDGYLKAAEKAGVPLVNSFVWNRFKGVTPAQLIWHNVHQNLDAWAARADTQYANRTAMAASNQRFQDVMTCAPVLGTVRPVFQREGAQPLTDSVISLSACRLQHGVGPADVKDLTDHIAGVLGGLGDKAPNALFMISPMTGGPDTPDLVFAGVNASASAWAGVVAAVSGSDSGPMLGRHFNATVDCQMSLWGSTQVVSIEE